MRRKLIVLGCITVLATAPSAWATTAPASWSQGFPTASAISPSLGNYQTAPEISTSTSKSRWYVCPDLQARASSGVATAVYEQTPVTPGLVRADARVYASPAQAKGAFDAITSNLDKCAGTSVEESEPGSGLKWQDSTTVGTVPSLTVNGTASLFIYVRQKPAKGSAATQAQLGSTYSVLSLSGDTILVSAATVNGKSNVTTAQRNAVTSFAGNFVQSWSTANA